MPIKQDISICYFKILLYDDTLALLMRYHIVFVLIPQPWSSHQQHVFCNVWHMPSFRVTIFDTEFMALSYPKSYIKIAYILYYYQKSVPYPFLGANFSSQDGFLWKLRSPILTFSPFILKHRPVHMTEVTSKTNNFIDICSILSKFHMCMYDTMKNIYAQNQSSIHCSCVWKAVHNRTFWIILVYLKGPNNQRHSKWIHFRINTPLN